MLEEGCTAALLVIDLQPAFTDTIKDADYAQRVAQTIAYMRARLPAPRIVHIRADYVNSPMRTRSGDLNPSRIPPNGGAAAKWAAEVESEPVFVKSTINGFHNTGLEEHLKAQSVTRLYCIGMLTAACVHSTAVGGMNR
jgi:nicotinamidase-related amidase